MSIACAKDRKFWQGQSLIVSLLYQTAPIVVKYLSCIGANSVLALALIKKLGVCTVVEMVCVIKGILFRWV